MTKKNLIRETIFLFQDEKLIVAEFANELDKAQKQEKEERNGSIEIEDKVNMAYDKMFSV